MNSNPLIAAYRKPALYVALPSGGRFYEPAPKLSIDNELAVYAMTARDELITKTPDALFNGEATSALIKSCCPDIPNPDQIPVSDLLVLMLAIRSASYGKDLDVDVQCPECNHINMLTVDSTRILGSAKQVTDNTTVELENEFKVNVTPYTLKDRTLLQIQQIKQQRLLQVLTSTNDNLTDEERDKQFGATFVELADLTVELISNCIHSVMIPDGESIKDRETILEWLKTISRKDYDAIKTKVEELSEPALNNKFKSTCQQCNHTWETPIELDMANFFAG
jgi:hypothetical protein